MLHPTAAQLELGAKLIDGFSVTPLFDKKGVFTCSYQLSGLSLGGKSVSVVWTPKLLSWQNPSEGKSPDHLELQATFEPQLVKLASGLLVTSICDVFAKHGYDLEQILTPAAVLFIEVMNF